MAEQTKKFRRNNLDQSIEELSQGEIFLPEVRLLQDLRRAQRAHDQMVTRATERVWQRLQASKRTESALRPELSSIPFQSFTDNGRKELLDMNTTEIPGRESAHMHVVKPPKKRSPLVALLAALTAVIVGSLLVGAFALLTRNHPGTTTVAKQGTTAATQEQSPALYISWWRGVYKLDKQSGKVLWTFLPKGQQFAPNPLLLKSVSDIEFTTDKTLYIIAPTAGKSGNSNSVYALNTTDGKVIWSFTPAQGIVAGRIVQSNGILLAQVVNISSTGAETVAGLIALDSHNGHLVWSKSFQSLGGVYTKDTASTEKNGIVYISFIEGYTNIIGALHVQDGTMVWQVPIRDPQSWLSPLLVTDQAIYALVTSGNNSTVLQAFNPQTGETLWSSSPTSNVSITPSAPVLENGVIYFSLDTGSEGDMTGSIFALDAATGKQLHVYSFPLEIDESPLAVNGKLYVSYAFHGNPLQPGVASSYGNEGILALDSATGHQFWMNTDAGEGDHGGYPASLTPDASALYFVTTNNLSEALNPATGEKIWQQILPY